jgi:uncharacterized membrane protein
VAASPEPQTAPSDAESLAVLELRARQQEQVGRHQRFVERVTHALGRPRTIYLILLLVAAWVAYNLLARAVGLPVLDPPPFSSMEACIGLAALLMTTMVLTTQNRQARHAEQRAHLDLQVNILAEQKIAKVIALVEELRRDLPNVQHRRDSVADSMTRALDPGAVISALEETPDSPQPERDDAKPTEQSQAEQSGTMTKEETSSDPSKAPRQG